MLKSIKRALRATCYYSSLISIRSLVSVTFSIGFEIANDTRDGSYPYQDTSETWGCIMV